MNLDPLTTILITFIVIQLMIARDYVKSCYQNKQLSKLDRYTYMLFMLIFPIYGVKLYIKEAKRLKAQTEHYKGKGPKRFRQFRG